MPRACLPHIRKVLTIGAERGRAARGSPAALR
jgi:hypothetical protein